MQSAHQAAPGAHTRPAAHADENPALRLSAVSLRQGRRIVLDTISFDVPPGALFVLLGEAGSGKSALLALLTGEAAPSTGEILSHGAPLRHKPPHRRGVGVVTQHDALLPRLSLAENVAYPLRLRGMSARARAPLVDAALDSVLLTDPRRHPHQTTAAERQRAALARATVFGPRLLLLDEALSDQPPEFRPAMVAALRRLHQLLGCTTILATRVAADAMALADQVAVLHRGRIEQVATPAALYDNPNSAVAALACGEANLLPGTVRAIDEDGVAQVALACGPLVEATASQTLKVRDPCLFCLRPERIAVAPVRATEMGEGALDATVLEVLHLGDLVRLRLLLGSGAEVLVKRPLAPGMRAGQPVAIAWQPGHAQVFEDRQ
jgi:putative spermidine/putrescine transport system ATP-binding protein